MKKTLASAGDQQELLARMARLTAQDNGLWGRMTAHQAVCHLTDAYLVPLGERPMSMAPARVPRAIYKRLALDMPMQWPKGVKTRPEVEQGIGGTSPGDFAADLSQLLATCKRFYTDLPVPCVPHAIFGSMSREDWMRWGYLHADHHLRQFGR